MIDSTRFGQILGNLVTNAIKFTQTGGSVDVAVTYPVKRQGIENIMMTVKDTGIGIPEEFIPILFTKYGKHRRQGTAGEKSTGLGMALLKNLIDTHVGQIDVESEEGRGTKFTVWLPELKSEIKN